MKTRFLPGRIVRSAAGFALVGMVYTSSGSEEKNMPPPSVLRLAEPMGWSVADMRNNFAAPPVEYWPGTVWWWHGGAVTREDVAKELQLMKDAGIGVAGVVTMGNKSPERPAVPGHEAAQAGSPEWARHIAEAVEDAARIGIRVDFTPTTTWPLNGAWVTDDDAAQLLVQARQQVKGGEIFSGKLPVPQKGVVKNQEWSDFAERYRRTLGYAPNLKLEAVVLVGKDGTTRAVTSGISADGRSATFPVPPGDWQLTVFWRFGGLHFNARTRVIDHMSAKATRRQMEEIARPVLKLLPPELIGTALPGITLDNIEGFGEIWTIGLLERFQKEKGYDLRPFLPLIFPEEGGCDGKLLGKARSGALKRIVYDYEDVLASFAREGCFEAMREWANENGLYLMAEGHQPARCDHIDSNGAADIPELEIYRARPANDRGLGVVKFAGHLYERNVLGAEAYTWQTPHFRGTLKELREASDEMFSLGVNRINHHGWTYSPSAAGWPGWLFYASSNINHRNSWFPMLRGLTDYTARTSMVLRAGRPVADVAFYGGSEPDLKRIGIEDFTRKYDRVSTNALLTRSRVENGLIVMGFGRYSLLLLRPEAQTIPLEVLKKIGMLVREGANVAVLALPKSVPGYEGYEEKERELRALVAELFPSRPGPEARQVGKGKTWFISAKDIESVLEQIGAAPRVVGPRPFEFEHRQGKDFDTWFVFNPGREAIRGNYGFQTKGRPELWDARTGTIYSMPSETRAGRRFIDLDLPPRSGRLIVFRNDDAPEAVPLPTGKLEAVVEIRGPWEVEFRHVDGREPFSRSFPTLADWLTQDELRYFSGEATYSKTFDLSQVSKDGRMWIDLGEVKDAAGITLNGHDLGILIESPYRAAIPAGILKEGANRLDVRVCNRMENAIVPLLPTPGPGNEKWSLSHIKPEDLKVVGELHSGGLLGPVRLMEQKE